MEFVAKPVLEDKFWILEDNGQKVGTIRSNENGVTLQVGSENQTFKALEELTQKISVSFSGKELVNKEKQEYDVHGYFCKTRPFNSIFDLKRKLHCTQKQQTVKVSFVQAGIVFSLSMVGFLLVVLN